MCKLYDFIRLFRKWKKSSRSCTINFITTDALFDASLQKAYTKLTENKFTFSFYYTVSKYILEDVMLMAKPWVDIEHILFLVHINSQQHWILARLSIKDWCIYLYNSLKSTPSIAYTLEVINAYSVMLPIFF